jgi:hypothetical protein
MDAATAGEQACGRDRDDGRQNVPFSMWHVITLPLGKPYSAIKHR